MKYFKGQKIENGTSAITLEFKPEMFGDGGIVLAVIPSKGEFVTWYVSPFGVTYHGHYTQDLRDAIRDFDSRN